MSKKKDLKLSPLIDYNCPVDIHGKLKPKSVCNELKIGEKGMIMVGFREERGSEAVSLIDYKLFTLSFGRVKYDCIGPKLLTKHIGLVRGTRVKLLFFVLQTILSNPYRNMSNLQGMTGCDNRAMGTILDNLVSKKYVSIINRPRKLMMLNSYTMDKTYLITKEGKRVMREIYEEVGFM